MHAWHTSAVLLTFLCCGYSIEQLLEVVRQAIENEETIMETLTISGGDFTIEEVIVVVVSGLVCSGHLVFAFVCCSFCCQA